MTERNAVVGICESRIEAAACVRELGETGFDLAKLSVAGRRGTLSSGPRGRLPGSAIFLIPGIGRLVASGPLAGWIAGALEGAVAIGGLTTVGVALYGIGVPESDIFRYEAALESGRLLVIACGPAEEAAQARNALETAGAARIAIHPYLTDRWDREGGKGLR